MDGYGLQEQILLVVKKIEFAGNYNATVDVVGCSCEVLSNVTFNTEKVNLTNDLKVTGGTLTFEDSASLIQINNVTNSGNIRYRRATQGEPLVVIPIGLRLFHLKPCLMFHHLL
jgi:hypothetical protein